MGRHSGDAKVLLVEDSATQAKLIEFVLEDISGLTLLEVAGDGEEAMAYLRREGPHAAAETPDFVLLDVNMPKMNGFEVLAEMKQDDVLRQVPVVMLSASGEDAGKTGGGENTFNIKPITFDELEDVLKGFSAYWQDTGTLPSQVMPAGQA